MSETDVVQSILVALSANDCLVWRHNSGGLYETYPTGQMIGGRPTYFRGRLVHFGLEGSPDVIGFHRANGLFVGIEAKKPHGGVVSERQRLFGAQALASPVIYGVARSDDEALSILTQHQRR